MTDLTEDIKRLAKAEGAHLVGIAPVDRFEGAPAGHHPTDLLERAKSVIVIAHRFPRSMLRYDRNGRKPALIPEGELVQLQEHVFTSGGAGWIYPTINWRLQMIALQVAIRLEDEGYDAVPLPASGYRAADRYGLFSHRHAAVLAGLGDFGLNNLLLTPEFGPRVRLDSIITTAELTPDPMLTEPVCLGEKCGLCLEASECFGEIYEFEMAGKRIKLARFSGICPAEACKRSERPYFRFCYGVCPVGKVVRGPA